MQDEPFDRTYAEALRLAKQHLEKLGWKYTTADIGRTAREIIDAMIAASKDQDHE